MKTDVHPTYYQDASIVCANCSNTFKVGATQETLRVEICSQCHPYYTGNKVLIDTEGRADKFLKKTEGATGRKVKLRKKQTLEEKVNQQLAEQFNK